MRSRRLTTKVAMAFFAVLFMFAMGGQVVSAAPGDNGNGGGGGGGGGHAGGSVGKPDSPGKPDVPGRGKGGLYGDLRIVLRSVDGLPMLDGNSCEQPITKAPISGTAVTNPVDGTTDNYLIPLVDGDECDVEPAYAAFVQEVEFGRLNLGRSPEKVLARQLADATATLTGVPLLALDAAGRLMDADEPPSFTIDSPGQNLAIHQELQEHTVLPAGITLPTPLVEGYDFMDHAAAALGAAADKTGQVTPDLLVYNNRVLGTPDDQTWQVPPLPEGEGPVLLVGDGTIGVDGEKYLNYRDYSYDRAATYPGYVSGFRVPSGAPFAGTIMAEVFGSEEYPSGEQFDEANILAFAQRADDARAVIEYVHETTSHVVLCVDSVGTSDLCPAS